MEPPSEDVLRSISITVPGALAACITNMLVLADQIRPIIVTKIPINKKPPPKILANDNFLSGVSINEVLLNVTYIPIGCHAVLNSTVSRIR